MLCLLDEAKKQHISQVKKRNLQMECFALSGVIWICVILYIPESYYYGFIWILHD